MGLFSSIFGQKTSQKTTIPSFLKPGLTNYAGDIQGYLGQDPHNFVAPASSLQNLAFSQAANLGGEMQPLNDALGAVKAAGAAPAASAGAAAQTGTALSGPAAQSQAVNIAPTSSITGSSLLNNLQGYMDPALNALVSSTMADYNRDTQQQRAAEEAKLAGMGNWGSGGQFYLSNFDIGNALKGANLENQLRSQAFSQALGASNLDAQRMQDASQFNAGAQNTRGIDQAQLNSQNNMFNAGQSNDLSMFNTGQQNQVGMFNTGQTNQQSQFNAGLQNDQLARALQAAGMQGDIANSLGANQRADTALTGTLGDMQHSIDQAYASALPTQLMNAGQMFNPLMGLTGQTQVKDPSVYNAALSVASLFASDRRVKKNIERVGTLKDGLPLYEYEYANDNLPKGRKLGVMAQDVAKLRPWALGPVRDGYMTVNYGAL